MTDEVILCSLGIIGVFATVLVLGTGPSEWYHYLALITFAAMIPLSSAFKVSK